MHSFEANSSNVPAFLIKLWKLVEDPSCDDLITWSNHGTSFIIRDQARFAKELLPQYFKHNNTASFIRQLNMYGFRKVMSYDKSNMESDEIEFQHAFFCKGQEGLLELIKRKIPNTKVSEPALKSNAKDILTDLTSIREKQENMDNMLVKVKQENELLWRELTTMRQKHKAQEQIIQKVIQFLVSIVQRSNQNLGVQRNMSRMLHDSPGKKSKSKVTHSLDVVRKNTSDCFITDKLVSPLGPVIHEVLENDPDSDAVNNLSSINSPDNMSEKSNAETVPESECPLRSSLNSPINTSMAMEPLSILEPLQPCDSSNSIDEHNQENDFALGIPLDYINVPIVESPSNVITIPEDDSSYNIVSVSGSELQPETSYSPQTVLVYSPLSTESNYEDPIMSESLNTPQIPVIHIEDCYSCGEKDSTNRPPKNQSSQIETEKNVNVSVESSKIAAQNEHNYQLVLTDNSSLVKSPALTKNTLSNHLLNVEEELNWLQDQISSNTWNIDANKLLGLFSSDDVVNNEALAGDVSADGSINNFKMEPNDIVGNEIVQFAPSMLEVDLDIDSVPFLNCLNEDSEVPIIGVNEGTIDQKELLEALNHTEDQAVIPEVQLYVPSSNLVQKPATKRRSPKAQNGKSQKAQKNKRIKLQ